MPTVLADTATIDADLIELTAGIVSAHVGNNDVAVADVPVLIRAIYAALSGVAGSAPAAVDAPKPVPAVSVRASIKHDHIVCLENGVKLKMLKRYLRTRFDMSPEQYRAKWNLPSDYPMVAPAYAEKRRVLAMSMGLGRNRDAAETPAASRSTRAATPARRGGSASSKTREAVDA
jgi:predicted transcriptional regulator